MLSKQEKGFAFHSDMTTLKNERRCKTMILSEYVWDILSVCHPSLHYTPPTSGKP